MTHPTRSASRGARGLGPLPARLAASALAQESGVARPDAFDGWFTGFREQSAVQVERVGFAGLRGWSRDPASGALRHESGRFFTVEGLGVRLPSGPVPHWDQPIIHQPETGILGLLVKDFGGVPHFLMQAKVEPGNRNGLQLSPTVQATRSNYTGVHRGRPVPYLEYFRDRSGHRVLADVRQSEQGAWFFRKRNRNMVVEVTEDVTVHEGFRWMTLRQVHRLLAAEDLVNMDARTVLSCLPLAGPCLYEALDAESDTFGGALVRSCGQEHGARHALGDLSSWITEARCGTEVGTRRLPLNGLSGWRSTPERIAHDSGRFFSVIGVDVTARGREVNRWAQPMIEPHGVGVIALLVKNIGGVLHALMQTAVEPGYLDVVELAPTVQCVPDSYEVLPAAARPRHLDRVLSAPAGWIRFDCLLSEEGGRFYHALNRYLIVEVESAEDDDAYEDTDHRWVTLHQLTVLLRHSHYLNVQARSLVACLRSLLG